MKFYDYLIIYPGSSVRPLYALYLFLFLLSSLLRSEQCAYFTPIT